MSMVIILFVFLEFIYLYTSTSGYIHELFFFYYVWLSFDNNQNLDPFFSRHEMLLNQESHR